MNESLDNRKVKLKYFIDYWKEFTRTTEDKNNKISYFNNLEQDSINPILYNPKELFKEFIDEIERKNLSNADNKKFFMDNVNNLARLKLKALEFLEPTLKIIQQQFNNKNDFSYLHYILKFALEEMADFRLGKECVKQLACILFDDTSLESNKETLKHLVNFIVFELKDKGFSDKKITEMISDICDICHIMEDNTTYTKFPHNIEFPKETTQENKEKYYQDLKNYMDSLSDKERIEALSNYFDNKVFSVRFIFKITGIKGRKNLEVGDIEIYNPIEKRLIAIDNKNNQEYDETFGLNDSQKVYQKEKCNIAIRVNIIDRNNIESGMYKAIFKANAFFNCFSSRNFYSETKILVDTTQYFMLDEKNGVIGGGFSMSENFLAYQHSKNVEKFIMNTEDNYLQYYAKLINQDGLEDIDEQIEKSLVWKRKALESSNYNESILWHWVSIENLFGVANSIFHYAPKILTRIYIYHFIQQIYGYIQNKNFPFNDENIPEKARELIENMPNHMTYKDFIEKAKEICESLDKDSFFYDKLKNFIGVFTAKKEFKNFIENHKKQTEQKLIFLYRMRNKIAHNASNEYNATIAYYRNFASFVNTTLLCFFIDKRIDTILNCKSGEEIMNRGEYEYNKMLLNLEKYGVDSIINPKYFDTEKAD